MEEIIHNSIKYYKIRNFDNYYVSRCGKTLGIMKYRCSNTRTLKQYNDKDGYLIISLYKNKKQYNKKVHRLVAQSFIPNPDNKSCVNHINGRKDDNRVENLEWCTHKENTYHAFRTGLQKPSFGMKGKFGKLCKNSKKVQQLDLDGNLIKIWDSSADINRKLNIGRSCVCSVCKGKQKTAGGFKWMYKEY